MPITKAKGGRWYYQFDRIIEGHRIRANKLLPAGWTRTQADDFDRRETARLFDLATGAKQPAGLIDDAVLAYLQHHEGRLKNHKGAAGALALLHPWYSGQPMTALPEIAARFARESNVAPGTTRNRLAYLRAACRWYWKANPESCPHDPAQRMTLPMVKNARHVYPTRADCVRIFRAMGYGYSRDAARVAFYTGWRISEVLGAQAAHTPDGWTLQITDSKNGTPRIVPVHRRIVHLVRDHWPPRVTAWTVSKHAKKAMREVGMGHARLHDLRHGAASEMINAGIDLYTVGGVLGHKSAVSTARYAHLAHHRLRDAVNKIGGRKSHTEGGKKAA